MEKPRISVIIYLADDAEYVEECIVSLRKQTMVNFECLVAEDAVTDRSMLKALHAIGKDPRFKVLHFENRVGPGLARNTVLEKARGDYLFFPVVEDVFDSAFFAHAEHAFSTNPDIIVTGISHDMFDHKNEFVYTKSYAPENQVVHTVSLSFLFDLNRQHLLNPLFNKFFRRTFVGTSRFEISGDAATEDFFFDLDLFMRAMQVVCINDTSYHFRRHVAREVKLDSTINSFLARHRRVAAFYELLNSKKEATQKNMSCLQELYESFILDELVRISDPNNHHSAKQNAEWISFLREDPLFVEVVQKGKRPKGIFKSRFHAALTGKHPKSALKLAHAVEYARSFGPLRKARSDE